MKSFLRENPTIAFGLGLPLLLVVVFLLISGIPNLTVAPPQYDVLYATGYYNYQNTVHISVVEQKVEVTYLGNENGNQRPQIWRYTPTTGAVREIPFIPPLGPASARNSSAGNNQAAPVEFPKPVLISVPDLEGLTIDSSSIAPDGYEFKSGRDRYSGNVFGGLFYSPRYYNEAVLTKNGRSVSLPNPAFRYYSHNTQFVGWVLTQ